MKVAIVKVGGSLFDMPDLGPRLKEWLDRLTLRNILLVPGGGPMADAVREMDRLHGLGEKASHWLALEALSVNAHFLKKIVAHSAVIHHLDQRLPLFRSGATAIMDMHSFAREDERRSGTLPKRWDVTSDSLAVRLALVAQAEEVVLLKSVTIADGTRWEEAAREGWVDPFFPEVVKQAGNKLQIRAVNFRVTAPPLSKGGHGG